MIEACVDTFRKVTSLTLDPYDVSDNVPEICLQNKNLTNFHCIIVQTCHDLSHGWVLEQDSRYCYHVATS